MGNLRGIGPAGTRLSPRARLAAVREIEDKDLITLGVEKGLHAIL